MVKMELTPKIDEMYKGYRIVTSDGKEVDLFPKGRILIIKDRCLFETKRTVKTAKKWVDNITVSN